MGECPACREWVWEDEWCLLDDLVLHERCRERYIRDRYGVSHAQFLKLTRAARLEKQIEQLQQEAEDQHRYMAGRIAEIKEELVLLLDERSATRDGNLCEGHI